MTTKTSSLTSSIVKVVTGGFLGTVVTTYIAAGWDHNREQRAALQNLVIVWHNGHIGGHRDNITEWLLSPSGSHLRSLPEVQYGPALIELFENNEAPGSSILAVSGFFRTLDLCIRDERCDKDRTHSAFSADAWEFYALFGPLLRHLDCEKGYTGIEDPVLSVIRRLDDVPAGPDRCNLD